MKNNSILIIGAGSAGISAARFLAEKGFHNVTILEASDRIGGKCTSVPQRETWHELATSYSAWGYHTLHRWLNKHNIPLYRIKAPRMLVNSERSTVSLKHYTLGGSSTKHKLNGLYQLLKFQCLWFKFFIHELKGSKNSQSNKLLALPFQQWLDYYQLDVIKRLAGRAIVSAGYGHLETIPTIHCLRWLKPSIIFAGLSGQIWEPTPGFENVWNTLAWDQDIRYGQRAHKIESHAGKVTVYTEAGETYTGDDVIVALPMSTAQTLFPSDSRRAQLCSKMRSHSYSTIFFTCKDSLLTEHDEAVGIPSNFSLENAGKALVLRRTGEKTPTLKLRNNNKPFYVSYHYKADNSDQELTEHLKEQVANCGSEVEDILDIRHFNYMQTYNKAAIENGLVSNLNAIQGQDNIWFSTSSISFESIDNILDANEELVTQLIDSRRSNNSLRRVKLLWLRFSRIFKSFVFVRYWLFSTIR